MNQVFLLFLNFQLICGGCEATQGKMEILNRISFYSETGSYILCCPFLPNQTFHGSPPKMQQISGIDIFTSYKSRNSSSSLKALVQIKVTELRSIFE